MDDVTRKRLERGAPMGEETRDALGHAAIARAAAEEIWHRAFDFVRADIVRFLTLHGGGPADMSAEDAQIAAEIIDSIAEVTLERNLTDLLADDEPEDVPRGNIAQDGYDYVVIPMDGIGDWKLDDNHDVVDALAGFTNGQTAAQVADQLRRCKRPCRLVHGFALVKFPPEIEGETGGAA